MRHRPLPVDRSNLHPHQHTHTHTHTSSIHYIGSTHTQQHLPCCAKPPSGRSRSTHPNYAIQRPGVVSLATVPAPTHVCVCLCARTHVAPGNDDRGFFFQVESPDVVHIPCHTHHLRLPCREFIFPPNSRTGCLTHFHTHQYVSTNVSPPLSSPPACMPFCCSTCSIVTVLWSSVL